jgi:hypothetical protein
MIQKYSNVTYLKNFDIIKYNIINKLDLFYIDKIQFELFLKKDTSDMNFSYKIYFYIYILFNTFSYINYQLIPGTNRNVSFSVKLGGILTNKAKIETFIYHFLLEKRNILTFKNISQKILNQNNYIYLSLMFPLKEYIQLNSLKVQKLSYSNIEQEFIFLKFRLSKKFLKIFFLENTLKKYTHYFSFWKIIVKHK